MTKPRTLEEVVEELARSEHWPDRKGEFALCGPCTERSHSLAGVPFPCDGYNEEVKRFLIGADTARHEEREALRHWISEYAKIATLGLPLLADLGEWLDARSRPAAPEAKESDCTCGEQWPCPLHGGPPAAPEPTPSEKCPYCGLTTCRYGADPTSTCHAKGDSCRCSEQPDLPHCHYFEIDGRYTAIVCRNCGQPESAHRRKR